MHGVLIGIAVAVATAQAPGGVPRQAFDCASMREYSTCAVGVGALTGRIVASALACGLPRERWRAVVAMMAGIIKEVAADEADREEGMAMIGLAGEAAIRRRQLGAEPEPCDAVARSVDALARDMGVP